MSVSIVSSTRVTSSPAPSSTGIMSLIQILKTSLDNCDWPAACQNSQLLVSSGRALILQQIEQNRSFNPLPMTETLLASLSSSQLQWEDETRYQIARAARLFMELSCMKAVSEKREIYADTQKSLREQIDKLITYTREEHVALRYELKCKLQQMHAPASPQPSSSQSSSQVSSRSESPVVTPVLPKKIKELPKVPSVAAAPPASTLPSIAFGAAEWKKYFGDVGAEPPLPPDINAILVAPCPFFPGKTVQETHLLVLVPQTVNGQPLTMKSLGELVEKPLQGTPTQYRGSPFSAYTYTDPAAPKSHWALLTRDVIEGSRKKPYTTQQALIKAPYEVPTLLDATVAIFMGHVRTGTRLYADSPWTYTRCQEKYSAGYQWAVGGFSADGVNIRCHDGDDGDANYGVGGLRKFVAIGPAVLVAAPVVPQAMFETAKQNPATAVPAPQAVSVPKKEPPKVAPVVTAPVASTLPSIAFGAAEWKKYFGDVGVEPPLPSDINAILSAPCPYWPGKKVQETHLLILVPQTVNGQPLTMQSLGELVKQPLQGTATQFSTFSLGAYTDPAAPKPYWALLTRDVVKGSHNKPYAAQQTFIKAPYEVPTILAATVAIFMEHVRTGNRLYSDRPKTYYTRCQEKCYDNCQLVVGGFSAAGLLVRDDSFGGGGYGFDGYIGVGGLRKF